MLDIAKRTEQTTGQRSKGFETIDVDFHEPACTSDGQELGPRTLAIRLILGASPYVMATSV